MPLFEMVVYPFCDKYIVNLTSLRKLVLALLTISTAFTVSGILEMVIDSDLRKNGAEQADISIFWQVPPFALMAASDTLFLVSIAHFTYHEAPDSMKSAVSGVMHTIIAFGKVALPLPCPTKEIFVLLQILFLSILQSSTSCKMNISHVCL